jgi:peptide/nickel transport system substrate-binding protein
MKVEYADFNGVVIPKAKAKEPGAFVIGLSCGPDPDACVANRFITDGSFNYMGYSNPRVDELIKAERTSINREERARIFKELNKLLTEESAAVFTTHGVDRFTGSKRVQGWYLGYKVTQGYAEYWLSE